MEPMESRRDDGGDGLSDLVDELQCDAAGNYPHCDLKSALLARLGYINQQVFRLQREPSSLEGMLAQT